MLNSSVLSYGILLLDKYIQSYANLRESSQTS